MQRIVLLVVAFIVAGLMLFQTGHVAHAQNVPPVSQSTPAPTPPAQTRKFTLKSKSFVASTAVFAAGWGADYVTTRRALNRNPRAYERNPLVRKPGVYWGAAGAVFLVSVWLERRHPKWARWVRIGTGGAHAGAAVYNLR